MSTLPYNPILEMLEKSRQAGEQAKKCVAALTRKNLSLQVELEKSEARVRGLNFELNGLRHDYDQAIARLNSEGITL